jgi:F-type H+-transporting ATPase subunit b
MKLKISLTLLLILLAIPVMAADEHGGDPELDGAYWQLQLVKLVNFSVIALAAFFILKKPVTEFFKKRGQQIEQDVKAAEIARQEAEKRLLEVEQEVAAIETRYEEILRSAREEGEAERERLLTQAKREAEKIKQVTENEISSRLKAARQELKEYAAELAVERARKIIQEELTEDGDRRLIERSVDEIGGVH